MSNLDGSASAPLPENNDTAFNIPAVPQLPDPEELRMLQQATAAAERLHSQYASLRLQEEQLKARGEQLEALRVEIERSRQTAEAKVARQEEDVDRRRAELEAKFGDLQAEQEKIDTRQKQLEEYEEILKQKRRDMRADLMRDVEVEQAGIQQLQKTVNDERAAFAAEMIEKRKRWEDELVVRRENLDRDRNRLGVQVRQEVDQEFEDFRREKDEWLAVREKKEAELREQLEELQLQREQFENHLNSERQRMEHELAIERDKFQREQNVLGNRYRFQLEHLNRSREELDQELRLFRREKQQFQVETAEFRELHQSRLEQFEHYRQLLADREAAIQRQLELLKHASASQQAEIQSIRRRDEEQRAAWAAQEKTQRAEIARQTELLAAQAENLEERHRRLDDLREELERTQATTLEARMAVEEVFAQISGAVGPEMAEHRVGAARTAISDHYQRLRDTLTKEREDLIEERRAIDVRQNELRDVRAHLSEWIGSREEDLRVKEASIREFESTSQQREQSWQQAQNRWQQERIEAEGIIRDLLKQISELRLPAIAASIRTDEIKPVEPNITDINEISEEQIVPTSLEPVSLEEHLQDVAGTETQDDAEPRNEAA